MFQEGKQSVDVIQCLDVLMKEEARGFHPLVLYLSALPGEPGSCCQDSTVVLWVPEVPNGLLPKEK